MDLPIKSAGSQGALAKDTLSQKFKELIGMKIPTTDEAADELSFREAMLPPSLQELRQKLGRKAKEQKRYRFYSLYGLVCRMDTLQAAWAAVRCNDGAPGVDQVSIDQIAANPETEAAFLDELQRRLREKTYRAQAVRRVYIPKANGKLRPLGIPTVQDRVVQAAVLLILEPIFEADFEDCSLLANVYLHCFDHLFHRRGGPASTHGAKLIRYADDFVVLAREMDETLKEWIEGKLEGWLGLSINREKTRVVNLRQPDTSLDFLGYTFRLGWDRHGRRWRYWQLEPSAKALARERDTLRSPIHWRQSHTPLPELIGRLNRHLRGWANYFGLGYPRMAFRGLNRFVQCRLGKHRRRRSQRGWRARKGVSLYAHLERLGLRTR